MGDKKRRVPALWRYVIGFVTLLFLFIGGIVVYAIINRPGRSVPDTVDWETGDIFFSVGDSWKSVAVRALTGVSEFKLSDSTPSHSGIILRTTAGVLLVHESTTSGHIVAETPQEYLEHNGAYSIYILKPPCKLDTLMLKADIDSLMHRQIPFDFSFNHSDSTTLYCTELVVTLLEHNGCRSVSDLRELKYIYPQDLANKCLPVREKK